ncbi:unnamed protein product, partial [Owenia fusiformis]
MKEKETPSAQQQWNMEFGTRNEPNAIATLVGKIMPVYFPEYTYLEEGSRIIKHDDSSSILSSLDGMLVQLPDDYRSSEKLTEGILSGIIKSEISVEAKCRVPADYKTPVAYMGKSGDDWPVEHVLQTLCSMASSGTDKLLYISWSEESSTCFIVHFDQNIWSDVEAECKMVYGDRKPKKPTRLSNTSKLLKEKIKSFRRTNVEFLCEVSSLTAVDNNVSVSSPTPKYPYIFNSSSREIQPYSNYSESDVLSKAEQALNTAYELSRKKSTEVLVWMLSTTDRLWDKEKVHAVPVAFANVGYSLPTPVMRSMNEEIMSFLQEKQIKVPCLSFDGQWAKIANRSKDGKPLTLLQLQKDVWATTKKMTKEELLTSL